MAKKSLSDLVYQSYGPCNLNFFYNVHGLSWSSLIVITSIYTVRQKLSTT